MNNSIRTVVIIIVTAVWAVNFTAPVFVKDYAPSPELNVAFMAIIGVLTASYKMDRDNSKKKLRGDQEEADADGSGEEDGEVDESP